MLIYALSKEIGIKFNLIMLILCREILKIKTN